MKPSEDPRHAHLALNRFGLGARPGQAGLVGAAASPKAWLLAELGPQPIPQALASLPTTAQVLMDYPNFFLQRRAAAMPARPAQAGEQVKNGEMAPPSTDTFQQHFGPGLASEVQARIAAAAQTATGFHERLVWFWANHFTVSATRAPLMSLAGPFEREAVRPHVNGRFVDMLLAVMRHPAMLVYLDNQQSFGPASRAGQRRNKGLNENLARESLELHTLGVGGGYTQSDVIELARALTGWGVRYDAQAEGEDRFIFEPARHEPGERTVLGRRYDQEGQAQAEAVLRDLAAHPATARFLASKLARHFIADEPPAAAVDRLAAAYGQSGGYLRAMHEALVDSPEAWQPQPAKMKRPDEFIVSALRALGLPQAPAAGLLPTLRAMGQPLFYAPSPQGWGDTQAAWLAPDAVLKRVEWADAAAHRVPMRDVRALAADVLGPQLSGATLREIERAESPQQALVLLLASPDFQRR